MIKVINDEPEDRGKRISLIEEKASKCDAAGLTAPVNRMNHRSREGLATRAQHHSASTVNRREGKNSTNLGSVPRRTGRRDSPPRSGRAELRRCAGEPAGVAAVGQVDRADVGLGDTYGLWPSQRVLDELQQVQGGEHGLAADARSSRKLRVGLVDPAVEAVDEGVHRT